MTAFVKVTELTIGFWVYRAVEVLSTLKEIEKRMEKDLESWTWTRTNHLGERPQGDTVHTQDDDFAFENATRVYEAFKVELEAIKGKVTELEQ